MDLAQMLVRSCMRSFYDTRQTLVIEALIMHSALRDDDMAYLMGMNTKELHKLCGKLKEDRFLAVHTRPETKEGQQRPMNRTYYYIDYRATIDAIKWRVYTIDKEVQGNTVPTEERKEYFCPRCKSEWTVMEVLDKRGPQGFLCHKCDFLLEHDIDSNRGGHEQSTKLNAQFKFITDLLPKIDQVIVPENTFEKALASAVSVIRDETNPANETAPIESSTARPTAVRGMADTAPKSIAVTLTKSEGPTEADLAAEQAQREKIAAQNAMPVHFTHSTVSGEQVKFGLQPLVPVSQSQEPDKKDLATDIATGDAAEIDDYFARLKAEQAKEAQQEQDDEYETDDEDEEIDFEDVAPNGTGSGAATPASSFGTGDSKLQFQSATSGLNGILKRRGSVSASGTSTGVTSPATGPGTPNEDGRSSKRVKIEEPVANEEEESEEDIQFEDV